MIAFLFPCVCGNTILAKLLHVTAQELKKKSFAISRSGDRWSRGLIFKYRAFRFVAKNHALHDKNQLPECTSTSFRADSQSLTTLDSPHITPKWKKHSRRIQAKGLFKRPSLHVTAQSYFL